MARNGIGQSRFLPAGVVGCVPNVCARFSRAKFPWVGGRENKCLFLGIRAPFVDLVSVLLVSTWIHRRRDPSSQLSTSIPPGGALPLGACWGTALTTLPKVCFLISLFCLPGKNYALFSRVWFWFFFPAGCAGNLMGANPMLCVLLDMLETKRAPTPGNNDALNRKP